MISIVIALLIAIGGIGFLTWEDIRTNGLHFQKYRMQSKVILTVTGALILIPTIYFFLFEFTQAPMGERVLLSFFQAVTPRTAGFNTADLTALSETGQFVIIILMLIGGSPGSNRRRYENHHLRGPVGQHPGGVPAQGASKRFLTTGYQTKWYPRHRPF